MWTNPGLQENRTKKSQIDVPVFRIDVLLPHQGGATECPTGLTITLGLREVNLPPAGNGRYREPPAISLKTGYVAQLALWVRLSTEVVHDNGIGK